jgi:hypothetical protein
MIYQTPAATRLADKPATSTARREARPPGQVAPACTEYSRAGKSVPRCVAEHVVRKRAAERLNRRGAVRAGLDARPELRVSDQRGAPDLQPHEIAAPADGDAGRAEVDAQITLDRSCRRRLRRGSGGCSNRDDRCPEADEMKEAPHVQQVSRAAAAKSSLRCALTQDVVTAHRTPVRRLPAARAERATATFRPGSVAPAR